MKVTFLGTGTSTGVPVIGCSCRVCTSADPRNRRLRPSLLLEWDGRKILVDSSTDFRQQALQHREVRPMPSFTPTVTPITSWGWTT